MRLTSFDYYSRISPFKIDDRQQTHSASLSSPLFVSQTMRHLKVPCFQNLTSSRKIRAEKVYFRQRNFFSSVSPICERRFSVFTSHKMSDERGNGKWNEKSGECDIKKWTDLVTGIFSNERSGFLKLKMRRKNEKFGNKVKLVFSYANFTHLIKWIRLFSFSTYLICFGWNQQTILNCFSPMEEIFQFLVLP